VVGVWWERKLRSAGKVLGERTGLVPERSQHPLPPTTHLGLRQERFHFACSRHALVVVIIIHARDKGNILFAHVDITNPG
jgi:hypothetical protein